MLIRNYFSKVFLFLIIFTSITAFGQKQVDLNALENENPGLFSGRYFRGGVGIARASQNYGSTFTGIAVSPLNLNLEFGTRIKRTFGFYFGICANVMLKETYTAGLNLVSWSQSSLNLGGLYYLKGGNSYIAPEVGVAVGVIEDIYALEDNVGVHTALKYGYDWHLLEKFYLGAQAFIAYDHCKHSDDYIDVGTGEVLISSTVMFGVNLTVKLGN